MSPEVWQEVRALIRQAAAAIDVPVEFPNERMPGGAASMPPFWFAIDIGADTSAKIELGADVWEEHGTIWLHLMMPVNAGVEVGLLYCRALSLAFRNAQPGLEGLYYRDHSVQPLGPEEGVSRRLSLLVRYSYTNTQTTN